MEDVSILRNARDFRREDATMARLRNHPDEVHTSSLSAGWSRSGTFSFNSSSQTRAFPSDGVRQSPRGESEPPDEIFGPLGRAEAKQSSAARDALDCFVASNSSQ
jgi:hypothetical protein